MAQQEVDATAGMMQDERWEMQISERTTVTISHRQVFGFIIKRKIKLTKKNFSSYARLTRK